MGCSSPMVSLPMPGKTKNGKTPRRFIGKATSIWSPNGSAPVNGMLNRCKQCLECRIFYSQSWAIRLMHESKSHNNACFLTLTYDESSLPKTPTDLATLFPTHLELFWKRLRSRLEYNYGKSPETKIKYFAVGEYGDASARPHYHAALYGGPFSTGVSLAEVFRTAEPSRAEEDSRTGGPQFSQADIGACWPYGRHRFSELTFESAAYVARYVVKKVSGAAKEAHYGDRVPEFSRSSNGLGKEYAMMWQRDHYPADQVFMGDRGFMPVPQYYDRLLEKVDPALYEKIKQSREREKPTPDEWFEDISTRHRTGRFNKLRHGEFGKRLVE